MKYVIVRFLHIVDSGLCNIVPTLFEAQWGVKGVREGSAGLGENKRRADNKA